ncbi:hypothetical protein [Nostoc sp. CMAA1605]|uniref:hypothetical protein n=1 Tax=Nostoc sp. CMAA1605 TaxID=2055159 RepID=UPI001F216C67|nr:hypothetical protein [Nostoc sp. CMAA1605]MCF4966560.1 hypothetical protein [Nostoc sp. CMAA1605]
MRIWAATFLFTSSLLMSGIVDHPSVFANNTKTPSQSQLNKIPQIEVSKAEFGVAKIDSQGTFHFTPTTKVVLEEGSKYGWRIQLQNVQGEVTWREVIRLPKPPETWATDNGENFKLSPDGTEAISHRTQLAKNGVIENFWTIAPGDPPGKHTIHVYVDNRLVGNFEFEILPSVKQEVGRGRKNR